VKDGIAHHSLVRDQTSRGIFWSRRLDTADYPRAVAKPSPASGTESTTAGASCRYPPASSPARGHRPAEIPGPISSISWGTLPSCVQLTLTIAGRKCQAEARDQRINSTRPRFTHNAQALTLGFNIPGVPIGLLRRNAFSGTTKYHRKHQCRPWRASVYQSLRSISKITVPTCSQPSFESYSTFGQERTSVRQPASARHLHKMLSQYPDAGLHRGYIVCSVVDLYEIHAKLNRNTTGRGIRLQTLY